MSQEGLGRIQTSRIDTSWIRKRHRKKSRRYSDKMKTRSEGARHGCLPLRKGEKKQANPEGKELSNIARDDLKQHTGDVS